MTVPIPTLALFDLSGKNALVTGAARGIGEAIAKRLADAGASVVVTDIETAAAELVAASIRDAGGSAIAVGADLTDAAAIDRLISVSIDAFGSIDLLVNNAALRDFLTWKTLTPELWDRFMAVNTKAVFFLSQAVAKTMIETGRGGAMVNIASTAAVHPVRWKVDYNAAKAAVAMISKSLAVELGEYGIRVNAVGPGGTRTPGGSGSIPTGFSPEMLQKMGADWQERMPLSVGLLDPDDIARAVLFLLSDASRCVTGQILYVDGGYLVG